ncbi:hypothetical protein OIU85_017297 [Salix viminalis]|uniref:Uncharacterized protein n=1 Tax=Salix viminalis TaxID=40686 RepID=A0A9Q0ZQR9_SALVM|nr:hypothetical protein OIU85_017297 [Salix viminalis]
MPRTLSSSSTMPVSVSETWREQSKGLHTDPRPSRALLLSLPASTSINEFEFNLTVSFCGNKEVEAFIGGGQEQVLPPYCPYPRFARGVLILIGALKAVPPPLQTLAVRLAEEMTPHIDLRFSTVVTFVDSFHSAPPCKQILF